MELMVEFYSFERAKRSCGPLYVRQQQHALEHWHDIIYRPTTGMARHTAVSRGRGVRGEDVMVVEKTDVGTERAETEGLLILAPYLKIDKYGFPA
jgi:hypothetical protein